MRWVAASILIILVGCSHPPSLVGKWSERDVPKAGVLEFKADGTFRWDLLHTPQVSSVDQGTYRFDGSMLTVNSTGATITRPKGTKTVKPEAWSAKVTFQGDVMTLDEPSVGPPVPFRRVN